jgi:hypothetical protein
MTGGSSAFSIIKFRTHSLWKPMKPRFANCRLKRSSSIAPWMVLYPLSHRRTCGNIDEDLPQVSDFLRVPCAVRGLLNRSWCRSETAVSRRFPPQSGFGSAVARVNVTAGISSKSVLASGDLLKAGPQ